MEENIVGLEPAKSPALIKIGNLNDTVETCSAYHLYHALFMKLMSELKEMRDWH